MHLAGKPVYCGRALRLAIGPVDQEINLILRNPGDHRCPLFRVQARTFSQPIAISMKAASQFGHS